jgi:hypothetical protein
MSAGPCVVHPSGRAVSGEETGADVRDAERRKARHSVATPPFRRAVTDLCGLGVAGGDLRTLLRRVAELASDGIPGVDAASVVVGDPAEPQLLATSSTLAQSGDGLQHLAGGGPTFEAFRSGQVAATGDLRGGTRHGALLRGGPADVRSCVALPVAVAGGTSGDTSGDTSDTAPGHTARHTAGVVTLYARGREALDAQATGEAAGPFVAAAGALVRDAHVFAGLVAERDQLQEGLRYRAPIEQAKGMIMATRGCDPDEAFRVLVRLSNVANRKLRDVAQDYVANGGPPPGRAGGTRDRSSERPGARRSERPSGR